MQNIVVSRYRKGSQHPIHAWDGWIEPEDRSWILFIPADGGVPHLMVHRNISPEERETRGFNTNITGEYVDPEDMPSGEKPTPNLPQAPEK